ncbi:hypothetical protein ACHAXS_006281, partial [Conticribra weissflogii]
MMYGSYFRIRFLHILRHNTIVPPTTVPVICRKDTKRVGTSTSTRLTCYSDISQRRCH